MGPRNNTRNYQRGRSYDSSQSERLLSDNLRLQRLADSLENDVRSLTSENQHLRVAYDTLLEKRQRERLSRSSTATDRLVRELENRLAEKTEGYRKLSDRLRAERDRERAGNVRLESEVRRMGVLIGKMREDLVGEKAGSDRERAVGERLRRDNSKLVEELRLVDAENGEREMRIRFLEGVVRRMGGYD
jgi:hypothetical protein